MIHAAVVPELPGSLDRIDGGVPSPGGFIAYTVHQSMMDSTDGTANSSLALRPLDALLGHHEDPIGQS